MTRRRTPWRGALVAAAAASCLTACVQVPSAGPVVETTESVQPTPIENPDNNPPPPQPGMTPTEIVSGFFEAMTATPLQTSTAQLFLTSTGRSLWKPQQSVVAYGSLRSAARGGRRCTVRLRGADRVGAGGQWLGSLDSRRFADELPDAPGERRVADRRGSERAARPARVLRPDLPGRLALLLRPERPDPGPRGRAHAPGAAAHDRADAGPRARASGPRWPGSSAPSSRPGSP